MASARANLPWPGDLAAHLSVPWSQEGARVYLQRVNRPLTPADIEPIARLQVEFEDQAIQASGQLVSTTPISCPPWSTANPYYQQCPDWIVKQASVRQADLYLLCSTDLPWVDEALQRGPGTAEQRARIHQEFLFQLNRFHTPYRLVSGLREERSRCALSIIAQHFDVGEESPEPFTEPEVLTSR
ncbi:MAG: hypothetical protein CM1200mP20_17190 [Pseudomonadota bacterium]|nr:MAG: hypothetical protein CM1200mP20_17190 [Pseudomonadota bacterium]